MRIEVIVHYRADYSTQYIIELVVYNEYTPIPRAEKTGWESTRIWE